MKNAAILITSIAALAACNKSPEIRAENASVAEVAQKVREAGVGGEGFLNPGQWRAVSTLEEMTMPGMSAEAQAQMKQMMSKASNATFEYCLTPEEAKQPSGKFFSGKDKGNCRYEHFTMGDGKIDAVMRCEGDQGGTMTMAMNGTFSPEAYTSHGEMKVDGGREGGMTMKMRTEAKRIGQCSSKTAQG